MQLWDLVVIRQRSQLLQLFLLIQWTSPNLASYQPNPNSQVTNKSQMQTSMNLRKWLLISKPLFKLKIFKSSDLRKKKRPFQPILLHNCLMFVMSLLACLRSQSRSKRSWMRGFRSSSMNLKRLKLAVQRLLQELHLNKRRRLRLSKLKVRRNWSCRSPRSRSSTSK